MTRRDDWTARLAECVELYRHTKFEYGKHDCCLFVMRCIDAMHGTYFYQKNAGRCKTEKGAARILKGYGGLEGAVEDVFKASPIPATLAGRGDIALVDLDDAPLGIIVGSNIAVAGKNGMVFLPIAKLKRAWRL